MGGTKKTRATSVFSLIALLSLQVISRNSVTPTDLATHRSYSEIHQSTKSKAARSLAGNPPLFLHPVLYRLPLTYLAAYQCGFLHSTFWLKKPQQAINAENSIALVLSSFRSPRPTTDGIIRQVPFFVKRDSEIFLKILFGGFRRRVQRYCPDSHHA